MVGFKVNGVIYVDELLVERHLACLADIGFVTYYQRDFPIPSTISKVMLEGYCQHLNECCEKDVSLSVHEICTPYSNYFMIYRSDEEFFEKSFADGKKALWDKSNQESDEFGVRRKW